MGVKISELNSAEQVQNNDVLPIVQNDETKKVTKEILLQEVVASLSEKAEADNVYTKEESNTLLNGKVDKVAGKGLSTEDYTTEDKGQVATNKINIGTLQADSGATIELEMNPTNYVLTAKLKNKAGTIVSTTAVDLPIESAIVNGYYDNVNKKIVLVLQNGNTIDVPVGDLISGLQAEITEQNKLSSDLVDDTNKTNKFVTSQEKTNWNAKYDKPSGGIPKSDLSSEVQTSLGKADTALQEHQDISGKEDKSNKVTEITDESTDIEYPSAKCIYDSQVEQDNEISVLRNLAETELEDETATGTSITVNDSANAPAKLLPSGNTYQAQYEGKNVINVSDKNGSITNTYFREFPTNFELTAGTNYTFSCKTNVQVTPFKMSVGCGDTAYTTDLVVKSNLTNGRNYITFTPTEQQLSNGSNLFFRYPRYSEVTSTTYKITDIQLEIGSSMTDYEPYVGNQPSPSPDYPQTIHNVSGHNEFLVQNKNQFNSEDWYETLHNIRATSMTKEIVNDIPYYKFSPIGLNEYIYMEGQFKENTQYRLIFKGRNYTNRTDASTGFRFLYTDGTSSTRWITTATETEYELISDAGKTIRGFVVPYNLNEFVLVRDIMLVEGTTEMPYVEHEEQIAEFTLVEGQKMPEEDYLADDGIHHVRTQLVLDGTENWAQGSSAKVFYLSLPNRAYSKSPKKGCISNYFIGIPYKTGLNGINKGEITLFSSGTALNPDLCELYINYDTTATVEQFKQFLAEKYASGNPVIVEFDAYEETIEPYTELQQQQYNRLKRIVSYYQQTNVNTITAGDLEAILNLDYKKSNRLRIDALEQAIISLGGNV